jgi:hypothetical protein
MMLNELIDAPKCSNTTDHSLPKAVLRGKKPMAILMKSKFDSRVNSSTISCGSAPLSMCLVMSAVSSSAKDSLVGISILPAFPCARWFIKMAEPLEL